MNWLLLSAFIQFGCLSGASAVYEPPYQTLQEMPMNYIDMGVRGDIGPLYIEGSVRTDVNAVSLTEWSPTQETYKIGAGLVLGPMIVAWEHTCFHPMMPYMEWQGYMVIPASEGWADDYYVRFDIGGN